jgi:hypothetical protein
MLIYIFSFPQVLAATPLYNNPTLPQVTSPSMTTEGTSGNPFDQNLNTFDSVTFNNVTAGYFCLNIACSKYIYDNGTAIIIQG